MNNIKPNLDGTSLLLIYEIESNILKFIKNKIQNFFLSIDKLFINNTWYNNHILKYIQFFLSNKIYPIIITGLLYIKSKSSSFQLISEEFLNIKINHKNKFILFLLLNSFESLIIKYVDKLFSICYYFFYKQNNNNKLELVNYYGKCIQNIFKHIKNLQNIIIGMSFYKSFFCEKNNFILDNLNLPIRLLGYGYIIKNTFNIFQNIKNIFKVHYIDEEKAEEKYDENIFENNEIIGGVENDNDNENICLLCLNKYNIVCCTPCGHLFCWSCIHLYLKEKNNCPKCKLKCYPQEILLLQNY